MMNSEIKMEALENFELDQVNGGNCFNGTKEQLLRFIQRLKDEYRKNHPGDEDLWERFNNMMDVVQEKTLQKGNKEMDIYFL